MDLSLSMSTNTEEIIRTFSARMTDYDEKLQKLAASTSSNSSPELAVLTQDFLNFKTLVWKALALLKSQSELMALGLERHEAFLRKNVLLLHGIPEDLTVPPLTKVTSIFCTQMGLSDFSSNFIESCHRLGNHKGKPRPILLRFRDIQYRQQIWENKTSLKGSGFTISEFLTKSKHQIFMEARKHFGIKNCWSSDSKIIILLPDKTRCKIELMSELKKLILQFPVQLDAPQADPTSLQTTSVKTNVNKSPRRQRRR